MNDQKILSYIYKASRSASRTLNTLLSDVDNPSLRQDLLNQIYNYDSLSTDAAEIMAKQGSTPKEKNFFQNAFSSLGTKLNTAMDTSATHIAEMLIKNSQAEVKGISNELEKFSNCTPQVHALGRKFLRNGETNLETMKHYL